MASRLIHPLIARLFVHLKQHLGTLLVLGVFLLALWALKHLVQAINVTDLILYLKALPPSTLALAVITTLVSYFVLTLYDALGLSFAGAKLNYKTILPIGFSAFAVGHNVGLASLSGGAIRYRAYGMVGLSNLQIALVIIFIPMTFGLGASVLLAINLLIKPDNAAHILPLSHTAIYAIAGLLALVPAAYVASAWRLRQPIRFKQWQIHLPNVTTALLQIGLGCIDLLIASVVLYVLLPDLQGLTFGVFLSAYLLALIAGVMSNVPGGIGVFESIMIALLPSIPTAQLLGAMIAFRLIYYILPLSIALLLIGLKALPQHSFQRVKKITLNGVDWSSKIVPSMIAAAIFLLGISLVLGASLPIDKFHLRHLAQLLPLELLELSHLMSSALGMGLLILAHGLFKRLRSARDLALLLLIGSVISTLIHVANYWQPLFLSLMALLIWRARKQFYRGGRLLDQPFSSQWLISIVAILVLALWIGFFAHKHTEYSTNLWWQFTFNGNASRMLRAELLASVILLFFLLANLLRNSHRSATITPDIDLQKVKSIINSGDNCEANVALLGDKRFLFHPNNDAFIMYQRSGRSWIALGDPVGNPQNYDALVWQFRELCDRNNARCVFYQVSEHFLPLYIDAGLALSKLGEEARVELPNFSLEGSKNAPLRHALSRGKRDGASLTIIKAANTAAILNELKNISDQWLAEKSASEKGFSLGAFKPDYLQHFDIATISVNGTIVAFANLWQTQSKLEISIDLMRFNQQAPKGVMDFLFIELMLWAKAEGYQWFNLGMAPLAGIEKHRLAPLWNKISHLIYRFGDNFYNFEGLHFYKSKFNPVWQSRYLACQGGASLPAALMDTTVLISGGVKEIFS